MSVLVIKQKRGLKKHQETLFTAVPKKQTVIVKPRRVDPTGVVSDPVFTELMVYPNGMKITPDAYKTLMTNRDEIEKNKYFKPLEKSGVCLTSGTVDEMVAVTDGADKIQPVASETDVLPVVANETGELPVVANEANDMQVVVNEAVPDTNGPIGTGSGFPMNEAVLSVLGERRPVRAIKKRVLEVAGEVEHSTVAVTVQPPFSIVLDVRTMVKNTDGGFQSLGLIAKTREGRVQIKKMLRMPGFAPHRSLSSVLKLSAT